MKNFTKGDPVEIERSFTTIGVWEPAKYVSTLPDMRGWYSVELPADRARRINFCTGMETGPDDPDSILVRFFFVPARRIRPARAQ